MVALRETHSASFNFETWGERLDLPASEKDILHRTYLYVLDKMHATDKTVIDNYSRLTAEIVSILLTLSMDLESYQVAFLYPAYEKKILNDEEIKETFGQSICKLLHSVNDIEAIRFLQNLNSDKTTDQQVDRVRRMLLSMVDDVRAVVIKLAERIAVIRAAKNADVATRNLIAKEIANIYAPLANRLGIGQLKWELEDLAFRCLHPDIYRDIANKLDEKRIDRERYIENFVKELKEGKDLGEMELRTVSGEGVHHAMGTIDSGADWSGTRLETLSQTIVRKMGEQAVLVNYMPFQQQNGKLKIACSSNAHSVAMVSEGEQFGLKDYKLTYKTADLVKFGQQSIITNELLEDSFI